MKILFLLFTVLMIISCDQGSDEAKIELTNFDTSKEVILIPYEGKTYVSWVIKANGSLDDTLKIKRDGYYDINLVGNVDTLINGDYYGQHPVKYVIDPYRTKNGSLTILFSL